MACAVTHTRVTIAPIISNVKNLLKVRSLRANNVRSFTNDSARTISSPRGRPPRAAPPHVERVPVLTNPETLLRKNPIAQWTPQIPQWEGNQMMKEARRGKQRIEADQTREETSNVMCQISRKGPVKKNCRTNVWKSAAGLSKKIRRISTITVSSIFCKN